LEVRGLWNILGALKHHVLEEMREAGASNFFIARPDIIIESYGNDGHGVVLAKNNAQTVGKCELCDWGL
jgi:hypothetical protein